MADDKTIRVALVLTAMDKMSRVVNESINKSITSVGRLNKSMRTSLSNNPQMSMGAMAGITAAVIAIKPIIEMTEKAEEAMSDLKMSFMKVGGVVDPMYGKFMKMGADMTRTFKGGKTEMYGLISSLINTGINADDITRQFTNSVAQYATVMKVPYTEAATQIGKIVKMSNLAKKDMALLPDLLARMKILGVTNADEVAMAVGKSGMGVMGLGGMQNMQSMAVIIAKIAQATGDAAGAGSGMQRIMVKMSQPKQMEKLNLELSKMGVKMKFFDKSGKFMGLQNMVAQLSVVPEALRQKIFGQMFGVRGAVVAAALAKIGVKGYNETVEKMMTQDTLAKKATEYQRHAGYKMEIAWAGVKGIIVKIGLQIMPVFEAFLDKIQKLVFWTSDLFQKMGFLGTVIKWVVIVTTSLRVATWLLNLTMKATMTNILFFTEGYVGLVKWMKNAILNTQYYILVIKQWSIWQKIANVIKAVWNALQYADPIVWIIAAVIAFIAVVVILVLKWKELVKWYKESSVWIKLALAPLMIAMSPIILTAMAIRILINHWRDLVGWFKKSSIWVKLALAPIAAAITPLLMVIGPIMGIIYGIKKLIAVWPAIAGFLNKVWQLHVHAFNKIVKFIFGIGKVFYNAGKNLINMLWQGMKSLAMKPVELIMKVAKSIRKYLPFSPAQEGPLKDIHRVKIIETIAQTMKPGPMLKAMRSVMNMTIGVKQTGSGSGYGQGRGGMTLHYAPVISISGTGNS
ncbi:MAG: phage tail tape measure protein, partial [Bacteroidetes bacterium]